jgi:hypothetical protein
MAKAGDYVETAADRAAQAAAKATDEMEKFGRSAAPIAEEWGQTWNALTISAMDFANTLLGPVAASIRSIQGILDTTLDDRRINMFKALEKIGSQQRAKSGYQGMGDLQKVTAPGGYVVVTDSYTGEVIGGQHFDNLDDKNGIKTWRKSLFKSGGKSGGRGSKQKSTESMLLSTFNKANGKIDASSLMDTTTNGGSELFKMLQAQHQAGLPTTATQGEKDAFENRRKEVKAELKKNDEEKNKKDKDAVEVADQIYGGVSSMVSSLEQMGIELPEGFKDMVGAIGGVIGLLQSIMMIVNAIQAMQEVGTFLGLFKNGGIVPHAQNGINVVGGNHYSGDVTPILANAGEVVLNRSQVSTLASQLQGGGAQNMKLEATVSGEQLRFVLNNNGRRTGRGEYVQSTKRS